MNADEIRDYIHNHPEEYLERDRSGRGYVCPICNSGTGIHGTGITTDDGGVHFTCWSGACFSNADIIDIIAIQQGIEYENYIEKLKAAAVKYGLTLDPLENQKQYKNERKNSPKAVEPRANSEKNSLPAEKNLDDFTDFYREAAANIDKTTYHRGIPTEILKEYHVGYIESWRHPKNTKAPFSPRLIIPNSRHSYTARDTRDNLTEEQEPYKKQKVGSPQCIFNLKALTAEDGGRYVIVVEGEIDALSIIAAGGQAVALGSTAMVKTFLRELEDIKEHGKKCKKLILSLDPDDAGKKATEQLTEGLNKLKLKKNRDYYIVNITGDYKDANDAYRGNIEEFTSKVKQAMNIETTMYKQEVSDILYIGKYLEEIRDSGETDFYPTGFSNLDTELDGGLYPGLYTVGAISSLGKTTFCLQIADNIAAAGHDILICSLEMAKKELMAKRLSRLTYIIAANSGQSTRLAKTTRGLLTGARFKHYTKDELNLIEAAINQYQKNGAANTYTIEGEGNITAKEIRNAVERHVKYTGTAPVILVDYLQMLAPADPRATDKQNTDTAVLELKRISRDYNTPVITISSFNRANYHTSADMEAFKESGEIEYSSDILIALEYQGTGDNNFNLDGERAKDPRDIELRILKNRNGATGGKVSYKYYPKFNYFEEA